MKDKTIEQKQAKKGNVNDYIRQVHMRINKTIKESPKTREDIADETHISIEAINKYCGSSNKTMPPIENIRLLAKALNVDVGFLLCDYDVENIKKARIQELLGITNEAAENLLDTCNNPLTNDDLTKYIINGFFSSVKFWWIIAYTKNYISYKDKAIITDFFKGRRSVGFSKEFRKRKFDATDVFNELITKLFNNYQFTMTPLDFYSIAEKFLNNIKKKIDKEKKNADFESNNLSEYIYDIIEFRNLIKRYQLESEISSIILTEEPQKIVDNPGKYIKIMEKECESYKEKNGL